MITILSQDGLTLIKGTVVEILCAVSSAAIYADNSEVGRYKTEERAKEVILDMYNHIGTPTSYPFTMPKE